MGMKPFNLVLLRRGCLALHGLLPKHCSLNYLKGSIDWGSAGEMKRICPRKSDHLS